MKNVPTGFRIATSLLALALGCFAIATILAETLAPKAQPFSQDLSSQDPAPPDPISDGWLADWAAAAAPLRGDLLADIATARAAPALDPDKAPASPDMAAMRGRALALARQALSLDPHLSGTWLLVAALQNRGENPEPSAEILKMSYLTSPADVNLIPARLAIVSASAAIADVELKSLARGDLRLILTRRPDLKPAIVSAYRRGSAAGKAFIDEAVQSLDPGFAASLR
jgi:hypothetical protein